MPTVRTAAPSPFRPWPGRRSRTEAPGPDPATPRFHGRSSLAGSLAALEAVAARLGPGIRIADVGCGVGDATIGVARAFPWALVRGFDVDALRMWDARRRVRALGMHRRVSFAAAASTTFPGDDYDVVMFRSGLLDLPDPGGAAAHARRTLASRGSVLILEPPDADIPSREVRLRALCAGAGFAHVRRPARGGDGLILEGCP